ncbi:hypothetical protein ACTWPT_06070 [Nonomuraea sp. 3N208]|uniref:hypothetical protein n=1 Tax=Nonomuraea sp. 3N208 TaxID=3457421 RepID=UPI003FCE7726
MKVLIAALLMASLLPGDPPEGAGNVKVDAGQGTRTAFVNLAGSNIRIRGDVKGGTGDGFRVPRPCWYEPGPSPEEMRDRFTKGKEAANRARIDEPSRLGFNKRFEDKVGKPGRWWTPAYNEADPNHVACMTDLDPIGVFVPPGQTPQSGITIEQLAQIARAALTVPEHTVKLNPDAKSFVNLPTWVWLEGVGQPRRTVTAELPGIMSVTLVANLQDVKIDAGTTADRAEVNESGCGTVGKPYTKGGTFSCGVRYLRSSIDQPREKYTLTVSTVWPIEVQEGVVPFQFAPVELDVTRDVPVGEIQSNVEPPS